MKLLIKDKLLSVELMDTPEKQQSGMMERETLDGAMVFPYDYIDDRTFHMKNCKIPLDIIFVVKNTINTIHENVPPCEHGTICPNYYGRADTVIELPGGFSTEYNIKLKDKIELL
tara:strand:+ start:50063 stop:50407 length:345 start_codon:yes stop_codon:yes gene_type:complete